MAARETEGQDASPSAGIVDSQWVKTAEIGGPCGFDAGKKVKDRKRHILTDTGGLLACGIVHSSGVQDRDGAPSLLAGVRSAFSWLRHVFADAAYGGAKLAGALERLGRWTIEIVRRSDTATSFEVLSWRWIVQRTLASLNRNRRLAKDFENAVATTEAWL